MASPVVKNFTQAVIGTSVSSPSDTAIGDLVICFVWSQGADSTTLTHAIQSTFTTIRSHAHEDGTTDGRLSVACKIAAATGTQTYTPYTITNATANQTAIACITVTGADTTDPTSWTQGSSTNTGNQAPDPPALAALSGDALILEIGAWHVTTAAATVTSPGANYTEKIDGPTGSHVTHLAVASREMTGLSSATEDPGQYTDNVTPNGTVAMTIAIPYPIPTPSLSTLSPSSTMAGGALFTLTVNGSNFLSNAVVRWNGSDRTTAFVNATQVTAQIPASDIVAPGTPSVTALNSGGAVSNALTFTIAPSQVNTRQRRASVIGFDAVYSLVLPAPNTAVTGWDRAQLAGKYIAFTTDGVAPAALQFRNRTDSRFRLAPSFPC